ncbi:Rho GTPase-activating protein 190, partial [Fragariocoptes setiger]
MSKKQNDARGVFNISVVGLSGTERDKGPIGIGKSCLCNRFIKSAADDYYTDHISVLSQTDFSGRVVNNDHWLYWGSVVKSYEGVDLAFNVIEQTEFVDDSCFQTFKSGKTEPYHKRCAATRLISAEKLMYICKSQLGVEREYEQKYLPDGKFNVDGFLCLFDVSEVQGRNVQMQVETTAQILTNLVKTKKPIVFVTTKNDESNDFLVREAERLISRKEFRGAIPMLETSAHEDVNVVSAFIVCSQLIDRTRGKLKIVPYFEAYRSHKDLLDAVGDAYLGLIRSTVVDYRSTWQQVCIKLSHNPEFLHYSYLHGLDKATSVFNCHVRRLRDEFIARKAQIYIKLFPEVMDEMLPKELLAKLPEDDSLNAWNSVKTNLRSHPSFGQYFFDIPANVQWQEVDLIHNTGDNRIPTTWLESREAKHLFEQRMIYFINERRRQVMKDMFSSMLSKVKMPVGKPFSELRPLFNGSECTEMLNDQELFEIYADHQRNLLEQARANFQELLLENTEHLHHLTSTNQMITQDDIITINSMLQHDERFQALEKFDQERTLMIIRYLSFIHSPVSQQCHSFPYCVETDIEKLLFSKAANLITGNDQGHSIISPGESWIFTIIGPRRPSQQLLLAFNVLNSRVAKERQIKISFTVIDRVEDVQAYSSNFTQVDQRPRGCFCIFTNRRSLEYVAECLEHLPSPTIEYQTSDRSKRVPIIVLFAADIGLNESEIRIVEQEGRQFSEAFHYPFMNVTAIDQYKQHQQNIYSNSGGPISNECASLDYSYVESAFSVIKETVVKRICFMQLTSRHELQPRRSPDLNLLMCCCCGDPFSMDNFMSQLFLSSSFCYITSPRSICLKRLVNGEEIYIGITITSYSHGALEHRDDLLHGFILICSSRRKASLAVMNAFSFNIACTPIQVIVVKEKSNHGSNNDQDDEELNQELIEEAKAAAERLSGRFMVFESLTYESPGVRVPTIHHLKQLDNFIKLALERKPSIEKAFEMDSEQLSSHENLNQIEEPLRPQRTTRPMMRYKQALAQSLVPPNASNMSSEDDLDELEMNRLNDASDESEVYSTLSSNHTEDQLIKPSSVKKHSIEGEFYWQKSTFMSALITLSLFLFTHLLSSLIHVLIYCPPTINYLFAHYSSLNLLLFLLNFFGCHYYQIQSYTKSNYMFTTCEDFYANRPLPPVPPVSSYISITDGINNRLDLGLGVHSLMHNHSSGNYNQSDGAVASYTTQMLPSFNRLGGDVDGPSYGKSFTLANEGQQSNELNNFASSSMLYPVCDSNLIGASGARLFRRDDAGVDLNFNNPSYLPHHSLNMALAPTHSGEEDGASNFTSDLLPPPITRYLSYDEPDYHQISNDVGRIFNQHFPMSVDQTSNISSVLTNNHRSAYHPTTASESFDFGSSSHEQRLSGNTHRVRSRREILDEHQQRLQQRAAQIESLLTASKERLAASLQSQQLHNFRQQLVFDKESCRSDEAHGISTLAPVLPSPASTATYEFSHNEVDFGQPSQSSNSLKHREHIDQIGLNSGKSLMTTCVESGEAVCQVKEDENERKQVDFSDSSCEDKDKDGKQEDDDEEEEDDNFSENDGDKEIVESIHTNPTDRYFHQDSCSIDACDDNEQTDLIAWSRDKRAYSVDEVELYENNATLEQDTQPRKESRANTTHSDDRPKPGKLDLKQFNNITDAIGRLNVRPSRDASRNDQLSPVVIDNEVDQAASSQGHRFFKSSKTECKSSKSRKSKDPSIKKGKQTRHELEQPSQCNRGSTEDRIANLKSDKKDISKFSASKSTYDESGPKIDYEMSQKLSDKYAHFSRLGSSQLETSTGVDFVAAPESLAPTAQSTSHVKQSSFSGVSQSPRTATAFSARGSSATKHKMMQHHQTRLQNHGIAVAPPQVPNLGAEPGVEFDNKKSLSGSSNEKANELPSDFEMSPITRRHLTTSAAQHKDSTELTKSREAAIRQLNEILANKPSNRTSLGRHPPDRRSCIDDSVASSRKDKKKQRDDEKLQKRRQKEEEKQRRAEMKAFKKSKANAGLMTLDPTDGIPLFVKRCIEFIEAEGLDAEGLYRVPGNRAHVDMFVQKFESNPLVTMVEMANIPVNAVATALKDFLSKKYGPIIPKDLMDELTEIAQIENKHERLASLKKFTSNLPLQSFRLLKYLFSHFVKVMENHRLNSMDSKNLAICWWPTLLPIQFSDMQMFEQMRPHLEEWVQTMIDQFAFMFDDNYGSN